MVVVQLEIPALGIILCLHFTLNGIEVLADIGLFVNTLIWTFTGEIFIQLAKLATMFFCSEMLRSKKLIGSTSITRR